MTQTYIIYNTETYKIIHTSSFYANAIKDYCHKTPKCSWVNANHKGDREIVDKINKVNNTHY